MYKFGFNMRTAKKIIIKITSVFTSSYNYLINRLF